MPDQLSNREAFVKRARDYIGVPWRHQGRTIWGIDCVGLLVLTANDIGIFPMKHDKMDYEREPTGDRLLQEFRAFCTRISADDAGPGDIVVTRDTQYGNHCGILAERADGTRTIIHSTAKVKKVCEQVFTEKPLAYFRIPEE